MSLVCASLCVSSTAFLRHGCTFYTFLVVVVTCNLFGHWNVLSAVVCWLFLDVVMIPNLVGLWNVLSSMECGWPLEFAEFHGMC